MRTQRLAFPALLALAGCSPTDVEIAPSPELVVAAVTAVLTVDDPLQPSEAEMRVVALITRSHRSLSYELPGATVRITGEYGQSMWLEEAPDPQSACMTHRERAGSCHVGRAWPSHFAPGELLSLEVVLPDGRILKGASRLPGHFRASGLSLKDGRCRLKPDTGYRFRWPRVYGAGAFLAEARVAGLGELWPDEGPLSLPATLRGPDHTGILFPGDFLYQLIEREEWALQRVLHEGLPAGASADVTIGAVDRNWANWIRVRFGLEGQIRVPSVFGDGTGWFGTAVSWSAGIESREADQEAGDDHLPLCGPAASD